MTDLNDINWEGEINSDTPLAILQRCEVRADEYQSVLVLTVSKDGRVGYYGGPMPAPYFMGLLSFALHSIMHGNVGFSK